MQSDSPQTIDTRKPPSRRWATPEQKEAWKAHRADVLALFESGMSVKQISHLFGRTVASVQDWLLRAGAERKASRVCADEE
jgi:hypothetical protein